RALPSAGLMHHLCPPPRPRFWTRASAMLYHAPGMPGYLFVVSRDQPELCAHLAREFSDETGVQVVLDRRLAQRWGRETGLAGSERRQAERRQPPPITQTLEPLNFALVRGE